MKVRASASGIASSSGRALLLTPLRRVTTPRCTSHQGLETLDDSSSSSSSSISSRRSSLIRIAIAAATASLADACLAVQDGPPLTIDPIEPFSLDDFTPEEGWTETASGILFKVEQEGEGDKKKGIFDTVDHFQPFPFVTVNYTAYTPDGKGFASTYASRRTWSYQAGVRQELQDEYGAVMNMKVGERRKFVVPLEVALKRKAFGQPVPQKREALLFDVELLVIQPY